MLTKDQFEHFHRLHAEFGRALEALFKFGSFIGKISLLLVRVLEGVSYLPYLPVQLLYFLVKMLYLGVWFVCDGVQTYFGWSFVIFNRFGD